MPGKKAKLITAAVLIAAIAAIYTVMGLTDSSFSSDVYYIQEEDITAESSTPKLDQTAAQGIVFSAEKYFYMETVMLELASSEEGVTEIYYTLDGTPPDSNKGIIYTSTIELKGTSSDKQESYIVKACGKREDGTFTNIYTHSYFIGDKIFNRFDVIVISLSTDPYNLYDYDYGIFVEGRLRDEYIKETGDRNPDPPAPANYNLRGRESERPVYVEVLDQYGNLIISQNAGMRTFGGWSRAMDQKSIKLYARKEYDPVNNSFDYDFFPDSTSYDGLSITKYKRLVLRNNSNDNPFGFIRDETIQCLAELTYLQDVQHSQPAAVFLNGEYYGFVWIHEVYDDNYLDDKNGIKNGGWAVLKGSEMNKEEDEEDQLNIAAIADYNEVYSYYSRDLTDDSIFNELCERIDINNFLTYYAVQIYAANGDWPNNNYMVYRYFGNTEDDSSNNDEDNTSNDNNGDDAIKVDNDSNEGYGDNTGNVDNSAGSISVDGTADGKWRWLLYDTDFGLGLYDCKPSEKSLGIVLGLHGGDMNKVSRLLVSLLRREDMKEKFVSIMCDLMNYQFSPSNINQVLRYKESLRKQELTYNFKHGGFQLKNSWSNMNYVSSELNKIINFGIERPAEMKKQIVSYLKIDDSGYTVNVKQCMDADITVNSCLLGEAAKDFSGFYYDINTVVISAQPVIGFRFSHFVVNGRIIDNPVLSLTKEDAYDGRIDIELIIIRDDISPVPVIKMIDYEGSEDYVQIYNPYDADINLKKYYISDDSSNLYKQSIADYVLKPGETLNLYCKNYKSIDALGGFSLCFNLKNNETLYITNSSSKVIEEVFLPKIKNDYLYVKDIRTGKFHDVSSASR